jgi:hypothetical protein
MRERAELYQGQCRGSKIAIYYLGASENTWTPLSISFLFLFYWTRLLSLLFGTTCLIFLVLSSFIILYNDTMGNPDEWLETVRKCEYLPEKDIQKLCEMVRTISSIISPFGI